MKPGWVYILVGRTGTLYTGVTSDLYRRIFEHQNKVRPGFASKYDCNRLVYYESTDDIRLSINREKQIKGWTRAKKLALVETLNPKWKDLAADWGKPFPMFNENKPLTKEGVILSPQGEACPEPVEGLHSE